MDLETENRLAALLMEEARRLRVQAEKEGVHVYLQQPNVRGRPNARFLTATVLGVQQANRAVEVGEMWRAREKELKLEAKLKSRCRKHDGSSLQEGSTPSHEEVHRNSATYCSSSRNTHEDCYTSDYNGGLRDEEVEEFLHSRAKRGRGDIGSRMDEPGPYISSTSSGHRLMESNDIRTGEEWEHRILGPEKPSFLKPHELPDVEARDTEVSVVVKRSKKQHRPKEERRRSGKEESVRKTRKEKSSSKHHHHKSRRRD